MYGANLLLGLVMAGGASACAQHGNFHRGTKVRRQDAANPPIVPARDWTYEASFDWGRLNPAYQICQAGARQSPISLSVNNGLSLNHIPTFNYPNETLGNFYNWAYGPAFTVIQAEEGVYTSNPSLTYDNETVYLSGWHIHTPADHSVNDHRTRAELHLVHVDATGHEKAVLAIRMEPGNVEDPFVAQMPTPMISFNDTETQIEGTLGLNQLVQSVLGFREFWTYEGSLTSPPCMEDIRWFVAQPVLYTSNEQMMRILAASTYSARAEQVVWEHRINE